jgi:Type II CAAX prenyl endopeptidase Rce1-like
MNWLLNPTKKVILKSNKEKILVLLWTFVFALLCVRTLFFISSESIEFGIVGFSHKNSKAANLTTMTIFITIFVSTFEELIYRLGLVYSPTKASIFLFGIYECTISMFIPYEEFQDTERLYQFLFLMVVGFVFIRYVLIPNYGDLLSEIWAKKGIIIFYLSVLFFGIAHIENYNITDKHLAPFGIIIILLPYFFAGYYYGLIRLNFGIFFSIMVHICYNIFSRLIDIYIL